MTKAEASARFQIPIEVLDEYEQWDLFGKDGKATVVWQYDDTDIECLSMLTTLHDIGFSNSDAEAYMRLMFAGDGTQKERLNMLDCKRNSTLDDIHMLESRLERLDCLRFKIKGQ